MTDDATQVPPPSGMQWTISAGDWRATVVEVGGGVRSLTAAGRDILEPYPLDAMCDAAHGTPLVPWPNRLRDGVYAFGGRTYQVALTEPAKHNAIHGFARWTAWQPVELDPDRVVVRSVIHPQNGYPFDVQVDIEYRVAADGLTVRVSATNRGADAAPFAAGHHPYLSPGRGLIDDCVVRFPARTHLLTDDRQLPVGSEPVDRTPFVALTPRRLGDVALDDTFTDLVRGDDAMAWTTLRGPDGVEVALWQDAAFAYLELFTGDKLAPGRQRTGLGVEPMTGPPNAFNDCPDQVALPAGSISTAQWGVTAR